MNGSPVPSAIEVRTLDPLSDSDWDRLVLSHPNCNFFHSAAWAKVLSKTYRHKPIYLHFSRQGELVALVPMMEVWSPFTGRRGVCLPFSDFCNPLLFDKAQAVPVLDKLSELGRERNWKYFELRGGQETLPPSAVPATQFYGHKLPLSGSSEELLARVASPVRRAIRKAEKSGVHVQVTRKHDAILEFYRLHIRTRRRHGLPPQPLSFFLNIYEEIVKAGQGFVVLAKRGSRFLAAAVFFQFGKNSVYKFGASDELLQEFRGSNLIMWAAIRVLLRDGASMLHFGRTSLDNDGLRRFKLGWGTVEEAIEYFQFDIGAQAWKRNSQNGSGLHNTIFRALPLALNRFAGAVIYPHLD
jgi:CelD/BcsL family acetyltransferase involved in cellulose biosynthesis